MKLFKTVFVIATAALLTNCAKPEDVPSSPANASSDNVEALFAKSFCAQTFNVYAPAYASNVSGRLSRLAQEIQTESCDVVQFQELWRDNDYAAFKGNLRSSRYKLIRADELRNDKFIIGLATAFDGNILNEKSAIFQVNNEGGVLDGIRNAAGVQKGYTFLTVENGNTPKLLLINLHTHPDKEGIRLAQMTQLIKELVAQPSLLENPVVLMADLNAQPDSSEIGLLKALLQLRDSYLEANRTYGSLCTYCANNPLSWDRKNRVIDFVLIKNGPDVELQSRSSEINLKGQPNAPLSDHYGVRSQINWNKQTKPELTLLDPIVQARAKNAVAALNRAIQALSNSTSKGLREASQTLRTWQSQFSSGKYEPVFERILRTP